MTEPRGYKPNKVKKRDGNGAAVPPGDWRGGLMLNAEGQARANLANARYALSAAPEWSGVMGFNEFTARVEARSAPPWHRGSPWSGSRSWSDNDDRRCAEWLQRAGVHVGSELAGQAVNVVAENNAYHPVRDYLDSVAWDGDERLRGWLARYMGAAAEPGDGADQGEVERHVAYHQAVGERWLISAVARIFKPGCKVDCVIVFEGPQGAGKSSALRILAGPWFSDELGEIGSKDAAEQVAGAWIHELPELDALSRAEIAKVKAFVSRSTDRFRPAYGRRVMEFPRQAVFAGTINFSEYLRDPSGARRFWPVKVGRIDLGALARDRDQLWAEAVHWYRQGVRWWLDTPELRAAARTAQRAAYVSDPWETPIAEKLATVETTSVEEILKDWLFVEVGRQDQRSRNRVAACLKVLGWERYRHRAGKRLTWRYRCSRSETGNSG
jgi:predicted P-loop ATPase